MLTASDYNFIEQFFFPLNFHALEPVGDEFIFVSLKNFKLNNHSKHFFYEKGYCQEHQHLSPFHHRQTVRLTLQLSVQESLTLGLFPTSQYFFMLAV